MFSFEFYVFIISLNCSIHSYFGWNFFYHSKKRSYTKLESLSVPNLNLSEQNREQKFEKVWGELEASKAVHYRKSLTSIFQQFFASIDNFVLGGGDEY